MLKKLLIAVYAICLFPACGSNGGKSKDKNSNRNITFSCDESWNYILFMSGADGLKVTYRETEKDKLNTKISYKRKEVYRPAADRFEQRFTYDASTIEELNQKEASFIMPIAKDSFCAKSDTNDQEDFSDEESEGEDKFPSRTEKSEDITIGARKFTNIEKTSVFDQKSGALTSESWSYVSSKVMKTSFGDLPFEHELKTIEYTQTSQGPAISSIEEVIDIELPAGY